MSFILDALKKSESERQRSTGPSLADVPLRRRPHSRPWWAIGLGVLLIVNLAMLVVVLSRDEASATQREVVTANMSPQPASPSAYTQTPAQRRIQPMPADYGSTPSQSLADAAGIAPLIDATTAPRGSMNNSTNQRTLNARSSQGSADADAQEVLPSLNEINAGGAVSLPELRLDVHVFSPEREKRFVLINMHKYFENQTLAEGPTVERIRLDGVVLNYRGQRFLIGPQQ